MNPALYTKWLYKHDGLTIRITVVGIWGAGFKDNYQVTNYELQQGRNQDVKMISVEKMKEMIEQEMIRPL
jgi:hypothetical protein